VETIADEVEPCQCEEAGLVGVNMGLF